MFRKTIFWIHLVSALISGIVIAVMSITGIGIAFEEEIFAWIDRDISQVEAPANAQAKPLEDLLQIVAEKEPDFKTGYIRVPSASDAAYQFMVSYGDPLYVNQYTGELAYTKTETAHEIIQVMEVLHRFFGFHGEETWIIGRHINGAANLAFLLLCLTGLYLWTPRVLKWRLFKNGLFLKKKSSGKARDWNWHNVFGFWSLPGLVVLSATAVVISYEWGHKIPFALFGEEATEGRAFNMMKAEPAQTPTPPEGAQPIPLDQLIQSTKDAYPEWTSIGFALPKPAADGEVSRPVTLNLVEPDYMPNRAWTPVEVDPYTGKILKAIDFYERSPGLRARVWVRFIHTGAGFGFWGKVIASLFTAASLVLVYTGFALSYRRFFR
ncbi:PepSY domain-containing protein [Pelagicoccus sp. NFK12]|uniref:PepSY domain-containing protein n=1 Tax=Pelagicoccus enzymogenes TaxID=2773457 RepID=A0A927IJP8_9BACT|nr:PepSY-associated TM helix domain-containing protein [Pelagicoccus enzymogenes]MBD5781770.1 PepSY domain-containing protein [Pelagicoccus enzymogenes]